MTQQLVLRPLGLITQPNKLGTIPQGALALADQCYMRQPGTIENANTYSQVSPTLNAQNGGISLIAPADTKYAYVNFWNSIGHNIYGYVDLTNTSTYPFGLSTFADESANTQTIDSTGRAGITTNRNRILVTGNNGTYVNDIPTHASMRSAGLPQPTLSGTTADLSGAGTALAAFTHAMYAAIYIRRFADGYEVVSIPSFASEANNSVGTAHNFIVQLNISTHTNNGYIVAGDVIQIFRTKSQTANSTTSTWTNVGSDYLLALEHTITAADVVAGSISITDSVPDASLGEALYTNAGVKTQDGIALPSPTAKVLATFKGYTFFLNRTDPPKWSFRIPVWWGDFGDHTGMDASSRANGVGMREVVGNTTSGSPTMTSIPAADLVGIAVGQRVVFTSNFPFFTKVTAVGASSITFAANATATGTGVSVSIGDTLEVNGNEAFNINPTWVNQQLQTGSLKSALLAFNCINFVVPQVPTAGVGLFMVPAQPIDVFYTRLVDQATTITVRGTNGQNYVPPIPDIAATVKTFAVKQVLNGLSWSEQNQPENVPPLNTAFCGNGEIYAAYSTRDCIWIFCSDGLYRLSGTGGSAGAEGFDWRIDPVDSTLIIAGPQAGCVLRDMVFAYTNRGLVQINSDGTIKELTLGRVDDRLPGQPFTTSTWAQSTALFLVADETNDEIWMRETNTPGNRVWIYNYITDCFTNDFIGIDTILTGDAPLGGCYSRYLQSTVFINATRAWLSAPNVSSTRKKMDLKFQQLLGDDPFVSRMWQQVELAVYLPAANSSVTFQLYVNGDIYPPLNKSDGGLFAGQRILTRIGQNVDATLCRTSWSIPRNAPAVANTISLEFLQTVDSAQCNVQGVAVKFVDLTEQRAAR